MVVAFPENHRFKSLEAVPLEAVLHERYFDRLHCEFRKSVLHFANEKSMLLEVAFVSQREDWIQSLVRQGIGVSVLPECSLLPPALDCRPVCDPAMIRQVEFATVQGTTPSPALAELVDQLLTYDWGE